MAEELVLISAIVVWALEKVNREHLSQVKVKFSPRYDSS